MFNTTFDENFTVATQIELNKTAEIANLSSFDSFEFKGDFLVTSCPTCDAGIGNLKIYIATNATNGTYELIYTIEGTFNETFSNRKHVGEKVIVSLIDPKYLRIIYSSRNQTDDP